MFTVDAKLVSQVAFLAKGQAVPASICAFKTVVEISCRSIIKGVFSTDTNTVTSITTKGFAANPNLLGNLVIHANTDRIVVFSYPCATERTLSNDVGAHQLIHIPTQSQSQSIGRLITENGLLIPVFVFASDIYLIRQFVANLHTCLI